MNVSDSPWGLVDLSVIKNGQEHLKKVSDRKTPAGPPGGEKSAEQLLKERLNRVRGGVAGTEDDGNFSDAQFLCNAYNPICPQRHVSLPFPSACSRCHLQCPTECSICLLCGLEHKGSTTLLRCKLCGKKQLY